MAVGCASARAVGVAVGSNAAVRLGARVAVGVADSVGVGLGSGVCVAVAVGISRPTMPIGASSTSATGIPPMSQRGEPQAAGGSAIA